MLNRRALVLAGAGLLAPSAANAATKYGVEYVSIPTPLKAAINAKYKDNCVLFLKRDMKINLGTTDLTFWDAKAKLINVRGAPKYGDVAMIPVTGTYAVNGHVAMVYQSTSSTLTILEANWKAGTVTMRKSTGKDLNDAIARLKIAGFHRPK